MDAFSLAPGFPRSVGRGSESFGHEGWNLHLNPLKTALVNGFSGFILTELGNRTIEQDEKEKWHESCDFPQ